MKFPSRVFVAFFPEPLSSEKTLLLAEYCLRFTPLIALRKKPSGNGEALFLEITQCRALYRESTLLLRMQALLKRIDPALVSTARFAFAKDAATALACARFLERNPKNLPLEAMDDFLSPFSEELELTKRIEKMRGSLKKLGIRTIHELIQLPCSSFSSRFSKEGALLHQRVSLAFQSGLLDPWPGFHPPEVLEEKRDLFEIDTLDSCSNLEIFWFSLKPMLDRISSRLHARAIRATRIEIRFHFSRNTRGEKEEHSIPLEVSFPLAVSGSQALFRILKTQIEGFISKKPFEIPVSCLSIKILDSVAGNGAQKDLFHRKEEEREDFAALSHRLNQKLGKDSAFYAQEVPSHRPEGAWNRVLSFTPRKEKPPMTPSGLTRRIRRPSRLLKQPMPITVLGDWLIAPHEQRWQAIDWNGPEKLSGEWWDDSFDRTYYQVTALSGDRLWVFRKNDNRFFLHGYFD